MAVGIAIGREGKIYVSDRWGAKVYVLSPAGAPSAPAIAAAGVANAASLAPGPVAPGSMISIYGNFAVAGDAAGSGDAVARRHRRALDPGGKHGGAVVLCVAWAGESSDAMGDSRANRNHDSRIAERRFRPAHTIQCRRLLLEYSRSTAAEAGRGWLSTARTGW